MNERKKKEIKEKKERASESQIHTACSEDRSVCARVCADQMSRINSPNTCVMLQNFCVPVEMSSSTEVFCKFQIAF